MRRRIDYPFAFGAITIAGLLFAIVWTAPWPQPSQSDWWSVRIGAVTILVLFGQLLMFWRQLNTMQAGMHDAAIAAHASRDSADTAKRALTELERPFVYVEVTEPGMSFYDERGQEGFTTGVLEISFFNYGRTPANLTRVAYEIDTALRGSIISSIDPKTVGGRELPYGTVSVSDRPFSESVNLLFHFWEDRSDIEKFTKSVWITGFVRYKDIFGQNYITGFTQAFDFVGNRFVRRGDHRYNYGYSEIAEQIPLPSP